MALDALMMNALVLELKEKVEGGRVEKVNQPEKDEIVLLIHNNRDSFRLSISAMPGAPRINITSQVKENPVKAPMFCMLLRKHLTGAKIKDISQPPFERICEITFEIRDEMGYPGERILVAEIMGKYSNLILLSGERRIISALKTVDFTTSSLRQVLPGMKYELPPAQDKLNPINLDKSELLERFEKSPEISPDRFLVNNIQGISPLTAREICYGSALEGRDLVKLAADRLTDILNSHSFMPVILYDPLGSPKEFSSIDIRQYDGLFTKTVLSDFGELFDIFFSQREKRDRIKQRGEDILRIIKNGSARLRKKYELQSSELARTAMKDDYKLFGDLITSNIYRISRGDSFVIAENYYADPPAEVKIELDTKLSPSQNAQKYYKKYTKLKSAEIELAKQIKKDEEELAYLDTVSDAVMRTETEEGLNDIRDELRENGYISSSSHLRQSEKKIRKSKPMEFFTDKGKRILVGKNNLQNDTITTKVADRDDMWFHVKGAPGSHVVLLCSGEEPDNDEMTLCCEIAAYYSSVKDSSKIAVDYLKVRFIKKPGGSKPGFVTYSTNLTAYVTPDEKKISSHRKSV